MKHFQQYFCSAQHGLWYRYVSVPGNWHGGTLTHWIAALSATSPTITQIWNDPCQVAVWNCSIVLSGNWT